MDVTPVYKPQWFQEYPPRETYAATVTVCANFEHGAGDLNKLPPVQMTLPPLYLRAGQELRITLTPDKRLRFEVWELPAR